MSHLKVTERPDRPGTFQIIGTVPGYRRLRQTAKATVGDGITKAQAKKLANEEAAALEARMLREAFHGPAPDDSRTNRLFAEIAEAYLSFAPRLPAQRARVLAAVRALGRDMRANAINQEIIDGLRPSMIRTATPTPQTIKTMIVTPISTVLNFGWRRDWCNKPKPFEVPRRRLEQVGDTQPRFMRPDQAWAMVNAAPRHLRAAIIAMFCTGSRITETLTKWEWENIDLGAGTISFVQKMGRIRHAKLLPAGVTALANLPQPHRGRVFLTQKGRPYQARPTTGGVGLKKTWDAMLRRAGLEGLGFDGPHVCRHTFASWHYAVHRNTPMLKEDGGWDSSQMVEKYLHLVNVGDEAEILRFWGYPASDTRLTPSLGDVSLSA